MISAQKNKEHVEMCANRIFQSPDSEITGKSVVLECGGLNPITPDVPWPYSLTDYLHGFIGKTIEAGCLIAGGKYCEMKGTLIISGSNFIGIQPKSHDDLILIDINALKCVNIIDYSSNKNR